MAFHTTHKFDHALICSCGATMEDVKDNMVSASCPDAVDPKLVERIAVRLFPIAIPKARAVAVARQPKVVAALFLDGVAACARIGVHARVKRDLPFGRSLELGAVFEHARQAGEIDILDGIVAVHRLAALGRAFIVRRPKRSFEIGGCEVVKLYCCHGLSLSVHHVMAAGLGGATPLAVAG